MILSRQALMQATPALDAAIGRHLIKALMERAEDGAFNTDGTSNTPVGLRSTATIGDVAGGTDGALLAYSHLCDLEDKPAAANTIETEFSGYIVNSLTKRYLRTLIKGTNQPFTWEGGDRPLLGHRAAVTNLLPSTLTKGASGAVCSSLLYSNDWSQMLLAVYGGGVDVLVDRVTMAAEGKVKIIAALEIGVGAALPVAFAKMDDAKLA
jgi:HK97 family phage major capsid protein